MTETFLDLLLIEEIPVDNAQGSGLIGLNGQEISAKTEKSVGRPPLGRVLAADTKFPWYGLMVDMPYKVGDIVATNEYGRNYEIDLNRDRKYRPDLPKFYTIHYADIDYRVAQAESVKFETKEGVTTRHIPAVGERDEHTGKVRIF